MSEGNKNNIYDKSYKDLFSNKETFLNLIQTFVSNIWGNKLIKENLVLVDKSYVLSDYQELESDIVYKAKLGEGDYKENIEKIFNADKKGVIEVTSNITKGLERLKEEGANEKAIEIVIKQLTKKFKLLPKEYEEKIKTLPEEVIDNIAFDIFNIESIEDLKKYF